MSHSPSYTNLESNHELNLNLMGRSDEAQSLKGDTRTNQGRRLLGEFHQQRGTEYTLMKLSILLLG